MITYINSLARLLAFGAVSAVVGLPIALMADFPRPEVVRDQSGNDRDGVVINPEIGALSGNTPTALPGSVSSFDFSGGEVAVEAEGYAGVVGGASRTVAGWFHPNEFTADQFLVDWGAGGNGERWILRIQDGRLRVQVDGGFAIADAVLNLGEWNHVAVTFEGETLGDVDFFINGEKQELFNSANLWRPIITSDTRDVGFGGRWSPTYLNGLIDEFGIWSRALSDADIQSLSAGQSVAEYSDGLELYYSFDFELPDLNFPFEASFGEVRFLEIEDSLTFPSGRFSLETMNEGSEIYVNTGDTSVILYFAKSSPYYINTNFLLFDIRY